MAAKSHHDRLQEEVRKQIERQLKTPHKELAPAQEMLTYLSWLLWHCGRFAEVPSFLAAARSDVIAILYAGTAGLERSAYLHARSLLENLVRHCYFETRPALFMARCLEAEENVRDRWQELLEEIKRLPHFRPALQTSPPGIGKQGAEGTTSSILFSELSAVYVQSSRFVHGSTFRYQSDFKAIEAVSFDAGRARSLGEFLRQVGEVAVLTLALFHLGPYLLISQPIRRYMMLAMRHEARTRFLGCTGRISLAWAQHQRQAALKLLPGRAASPVGPLSRDGLEHRDGTVIVIKPET